jgi:pimeloyl-ACP methyl ester carboxylesterase
MSVVIVQDEIIHYEVLGRGRPLFFIHSWVGSWRYWLTSMQAASISCRAYALDLYGYGETSRRGGCSLPAQVELLEMFLEELGVARVALVGHGLGATVALQFIQRNSERVDRAFLVGLPLSGEMISPRLQQDEPGGLVEWLMGRDPADEAARIEALKAEPGALESAFSSPRSYDALTAVQSANLPMLLMYGQEDPALQVPPPELAGELPENIQLLVLEDSGHFPMLDQEPRFNRLLADFLALPSGASPRQLMLKEEWKRRVR